MRKSGARSGPRGLRQQGVVLFIFRDGTTEVIPYYLWMAFKRVVARAVIVVSLRCCLLLSLRCAAASFRLVGLCPQNLFCPTNPSPTQKTASRLRPHRHL